MIQAALPEGHRLSQARRLKDLEKENNRLKKVVAEGGEKF
jgi:hypothetical protein